MTRSDPAEAGPNQQGDNQTAKERQGARLYLVEWHRGDQGKASRVYQQLFAARRLAGWKRDEGRDGVEIFAGEVVWQPRHALRRTRTWPGKIRLYRVEWDRGRFGKASKIYRQRRAALRLAHWKRQDSCRRVSLFVGEIVWEPYQS